MVVVVAHLVERLLPTQEICSSNPVIGKFYLLWICIEKSKIMEKGSGMAHYIKNNKPPHSISFKCLYSSIK